MHTYIDGPASEFFTPLGLKRTGDGRQVLPPHMEKYAHMAPAGKNVCQGIPFDSAKNIAISGNSVSVSVSPSLAGWYVFLHTTDKLPLNYNDNGFISPMKGEGFLGEAAAEYSIVYEDGEEIVIKIQRRIHIGMFRRIWGENCTLAVPFRKQMPLRAHHEQVQSSWGPSQTRVKTRDEEDWMSWVWAWENPRKDVPVTGFRFKSLSNTIVISGITAGNVTEHPLRWESRKKACLVLPDGEQFQPGLDENGLLSQIKIDLGQVISAQLRPVYPNDEWEDSYNNKLPEIKKDQILVEYTSHPQAKFYLPGDSVLPVDLSGNSGKGYNLRAVKSAKKRVRIKVTDAKSGMPVAVKIHIHGYEGEYIAPLDRHRIPNTAWFEDYSPDFVHAGLHRCAYIDGETIVDLPIGNVFIEVSKGYEARPLRKVWEITGDADQIIIPLDKVLKWREKGWVTADTHVHFLSPPTALLEGAAEGVNVVNLLTSQWGELMTNAGDFDGKTTHGAKEFGGDGEYLVRVGTENRQHIMGHISLLGYEGRIIAPMCTGGPDESAIGDPLEVLLTEWARQCRSQGGLSILPHFPNPRMEGAAAIVDGSIDGIEMTSWGNLYGGISPYSLSDWYRYLNCGYFVPAVGGTDKMFADTPVGAVRTYTKINGEFTYTGWMDAVRAGNTFVTYGPLLEFSVDGASPGERINFSSSGGRVNIEWSVESVTVPMSRVELVVNAEIIESRSIDQFSASGHWEVPISRSSWMALLVRGHYKDKPEIIAAHSSPVMVNMEGSRFFSRIDALTILEQIEGALAYVDTIGTRAEDRRFKELKLILTGAHRELHNRMHREGQFHNHNSVTDHPEHHV
jgi:hypothetical protein